MLTKLLHGPRASNFEHGLVTLCIFGSCACDFHSVYWPTRRHQRDTIDRMLLSEGSSEPRKSDFLNLLASGQSGFDANGELCILHDRLYLASLQCRPAPKSATCYVGLSDSMRYMPFCADFGPYNLGEQNCERMSHLGFDLFNDQCCH